MIISAHQERQRKMDLALQACKNALSAADLETFEEQTWVEEFNAATPEIEIPDEIVFDVDNDLEEEETNE